MAKLEMRNCYPGVREATEGCFPHPRIAIALLIGESGMIFGKLCKIWQTERRVKNEVNQTKKSWDTDLRSVMYQNLDMQNLRKQAKVW